MLSDSEVIKYADGIGVHWYTDKIVPASFLDFASSSEKKLFRLGTEACAGKYSQIKSTWTSWFETTHGR